MNAAQTSAPFWRDWPQRFFKTFILAHPSIHSAPERYKAQLLSALSLSFSLIVFGGLLVTLQLTGFSVLIAAGFLFSALSFIAYLVSRTPFYGRAALIFVAGFAFLAYVASLLGAYPALFITLTFAILFLLTNLFEVKWMALFIAVNVVAELLLSALFLPQLQGQEALNVRAGLFTLGLFVLLFAWYRDNLERLRLQEVAQAQIELQQANLELQNAQREVNARLAELRLAAEVGRSISQVRALDVMLTDAAELIRKQFDLYYVQVYLTNPSQTALVLQAGTGAVGEQLLARAHKLPLNTGSINGRAALEKQPVVVADTSASPVFKPNPLLPETRSEMAVPLLVGEKVLGVLDMQSQRANALNAQILSAFEALAGQIAIAIQNARLLAEAEEARAEVEKQARHLARANWQEYLDSIHHPEQIGYVFEQDQILPLQAETVTQEEPNALAVPISFTGEPLGSLVVELAEERQSHQAVELLNIVARQVAQHIESLRLLESAERYRAQAEEASRRLTREGWQEYFSAQADQSLGYLYDLREVKPIESETSLAAEAALTVPVRVRDETIGKLAVLDVDSADPETLALVNAVSERLSDHIESLRLSAQTQAALQQSEKLFQVSRRVTGAADLQELLKIMVEALNLRSINRASLGIFSYNAAGELESMVDIANYWNGSGTEPAVVGTSFSASSLKVLSTFVSSTPIFFNDTFQDQRMGEAELQILKKLNVHALAVLPLLLGKNQIGVIRLLSEEPHNFTPEEIRLLTAITPQIATVVENRRQFERARRQAEREALLNAISQKIQSATSVEAVLQIAARELGHALGAPRAIAQLSLKD
ncbi:MAG: hypothetical protein Fur0016_10390 [Anaerolineales bacterium]